MTDMIDSNHYQVATIYPLGTAPKLNFPKWVKSLFNLASNLGKVSFGNFGLLWTVVSDAQWAALPGNTDNAGVVVVRPGLPALIPITAGMTPQIQAATKANNDNAIIAHAEWCKLNNAITLSLNPTIRETMVNEETGLDLYTLAEIVANVTRDYGTLTPADVRNLIGQLDAPLDNDSVHEWEKFTQQHRTIYSVLARNQNVFPAVLKLSKLEENTAAFPVIKLAWDAYKNEYPAVHQQAFDSGPAAGGIIGIVPFIKGRLENATEVTTGDLGYAGSATKTHGAPAATQGQLDAAYARGLRDGKAFSNAGGGKALKYDKYCWLHGYKCNHHGTHTNPALACRHMNVTNRAKYTDAQRSATTHDTGGPIEGNRKNE